MRLRKRTYGEEDIPCLFPFRELVPDLQSYVLTFALEQEQFSFVCKSWYSMRRLLVEKHAESCLHRLPYDYAFTLIARHAAPSRVRHAITNISFVPAVCMKARIDSLFDSPSSSDTEEEEERSFVHLGLIKESLLREGKISAMMSGPICNELNPLEPTKRRRHIWGMKGLPIDKVIRAIYRHCPYVFFRKEETYIIQQYESITMLEFFTLLVTSLKRNRPFYRYLIHRVTKMELFNTEEFVSMIKSAPKDSFIWHAFCYLSVHSDSSSLLVQ